MTQDAVRLNKYLAMHKVASRRGADEIIAAGRVRINGQAVDSPGVKVDPKKDTVEVDGRPIRPAHEAQNVTVLLHKPVQTVTTVRDPQGRPTVLDLLPKSLRAERLFPVGRLDYFSEGLLLLTTDGELCHRLTHPRHHLPKVYEVLVRGEVPENTLASMRGGMRLAEGEKLAPMKATARKQGKNTLIVLTLIQGLNRQIRRACRDLGLTVLRLARVRQGPISLGDLAPGAWRELTSREVDALRRAVDLAP